MNFSNFFSKTVLLNEMHQEYIDKIPTNIRELLEQKKLPFNNIFGQSLRIAEELESNSEVENNIKSLGLPYNFDLEKWVGYKTADLIKKNPYRIGKILNNYKNELEKSLKETEETIKKLPSYSVNLELNRQLQNIKNKLEIVNKLLNTTNLQKQHESSLRSSEYIIIYSRAPVDVLRMSDFPLGMSSCHRHGGSYFYCALADAMLNAGVVFLVPKNDYEEFIQNGGNLQADEIFKDIQRNIEGIIPVSRLRLRLVLDTKGNQLAVPITKDYSEKSVKYLTNFKEQVVKWAKKQDTSNFNWDDTLTLRGGNYEDSGYDIEDQIRRIWHKEIKYKHNSNDIEGLSDNDDTGEEQFRDEIFEMLDDDFFPTMERKASSYLPLFFKNYYISFESYNAQQNRLEFNITIPDEISDNKKFMTNVKYYLYNLVDYAKYTIKFSDDDSSLLLIIKLPDVNEYIYYGGHPEDNNFSYRYYEDSYERIKQVHDEVLEEFSSTDNVNNEDEDDDDIRADIYFNIWKAIIKKYKNNNPNSNIEFYENIDFNDIKKAFKNRIIMKIPMPDIFKKIKGEFEPEVKLVPNPRKNNNPLVSSYIEVPSFGKRITNRSEKIYPTEYEKDSIKAFINYVENYIYEKLSSEEDDYISIDTIFNYPKEQNKSEYFKIFKYDGHNEIKYRYNDDGEGSVVFEINKALLENIQKYFGSHSLIFLYNVLKKYGGNNKLAEEIIPKGDLDDFIKKLYVRQRDKKIDARNLHLDLSNFNKVYLSLIK